MNCVCLCGMLQWQHRMDTGQDSPVKARSRQRSTAIRRLCPTLVSQQPPSSIYQPLSQYPTTPPPEHLLSPSLLPSQASPLRSISCTWLSLIRKAEIVSIIHLCISDVSLLRICVFVRLSVYYGDIAVLCICVICVIPYVCLSR